MPEELRNQFVIFGNLKINIDSLKQTIEKVESCSKLVEDLHYIEKQLLNKASKDDCGVMIKLGTGEGYMFVWESLKNYTKSLNKTVLGPGSGIKNRVQPY